MKTIKSLANEAWEVVKLDGKRNADRKWCKQIGHVVEIMYKTVVPINGIGFHNLPKDQFRPIFGFFV